MMGSLLLTAAELCSMFVLLFGYTFFNSAANGEFSGIAMVTASFLMVLSLEIWFARWLTQEREVGPTIKLVLRSHTPWMLAWAYPWVLALNLPDPHNFYFRKLQILLGVILVLHFFIYARVLLAGSHKKGRAVSKIFGLTAAVFFTGVTFWTGTACDLSGDEPHYLLMAQSLTRDGDLDLTNNYRNKDYRSFYHRGDLAPQGLEHEVDGKRFSHHPLGPVLLVLPAFALFGRMGAALTMALSAALALFLTLRALEETGAKGWALHATGVIGLFSSPLLLFSGVIYPEVPTACLAASCLLLFLRKNWGWYGFSLGLMLWMHNRNVLLVLPFIFFAAWEIWKNQQPPRGREDSKKVIMDNASKLFIGFGITVLPLSFYFYHVYGLFTPLGAHHEPFSSLFRLSHFFTGFFGLVLDQECGLWFHFPVFALALLGGVLLYKSNNPLRYLVLGGFSFFYLFMSFYENLGLTPAARYMVGVTPLLILMLYPAVERIQKHPGWMKLGGFLLLVGVLVNWILAAVPWMRYNKMEGENWILKIAGGFLHLPLTSWEPAFNPAVIEFRSYAIAAFWMVLTVVLTVFFLKDKRAKGKNN